MAARTVKAYSYTAHVQVEHGRILELTGTCKATSEEVVRRALQAEVDDNEGHLITVQVVPVDMDTGELLPIKPDHPAFCGGSITPLLGRPVLPAPVKAEPSVAIDALPCFGVYELKYSGSSRCTYKVEQDDDASEST